MGLGRSTNDRTEKSSELRTLLMIEILNVLLPTNPSFNVMLSVSKALAFRCNSKENIFSYVNVFGPANGLLNGGKTG